MYKIGPHNFRELTTPGGSPKEKENKDKEESQPEPTPTSPVSSKLTQKYFTGNKSLGSVADEETESTQETEGTGGLLGAGNLQGSKEEEEWAKEALDYLEHGFNNLVKEIVEKYRKALQDGKFDLKDLIHDLESYRDSHSLAPDAEKFLNNALGLLGPDRENTRAEIALNYLITYQDPSFSQDPSFINLIEKYKIALKNGTFNKQDFIKDLESYMASKGSTLTMNQIRLLAKAITAVGGTAPHDIAKEVIDYLEKSLWPPEIIAILNEYKNGSMSLENFQKKLQSYIDSHPDLSGAQKNSLNNAIGLMGPEPDTARAKILMDSILAENWPDDMKQLIEKYKKAIEDGTFEIKDFIYGLKYYMATHSLAKAQKATLDKGIDSFDIDVPTAGSSQPDYEQAKKTIDLFEELFLKFWKDVPGFDHLLKDLKLQLFMGTFNIQEMRDRLTSWMHAWPAMPQKDLLAKTIDMLAPNADPDSATDAAEEAERAAEAAKRKQAAKSVLDLGPGVWNRLYQNDPNIRNNVRELMRERQRKWTEIMDKYTKQMEDGTIDFKAFKDDLNTFLADSRKIFAQFDRSFEDAVKDINTMISRLESIIQSG